MPIAAKPLSSQRQSLGEMLRATLWAPRLTAEQMRHVGADVIEGCYPAGAHICSKGDPAKYWIGVVEGLVKLVTVSIDGILGSYTAVSAGGWFGEGSLLKAKKLKYHAIALQETRVALMPRATFMWLWANSLPFNHFLVNQLNERLGQFIGMLEFDRSYGPDARVAQCIAALFNAQLYPGTRRDLPISQEEIGHLCGLCRQRVNHSLKALERLGLLRVGYVGVTVTDPDALRRLVN